MRLKAVIFDVDGTLAETAGDLIGALNFILHREGIAPLPLAKARFMVGAGARAYGRSGTPKPFHEIETVS